MGVRGLIRPPIRGGPALPQGPRPWVRARAGLPPRAPALGVLPVPVVRGPIPPGRAIAITAAAGQTVVDPRVHRTPRDAHPPAERRPAQTRTVPAQHVSWDLRRGVAPGGLRCAALGARAAAVRLLAARPAILHHPRRAAVRATHGVSVDAGTGPVGPSPRVCCLPMLHCRHV